MKFEVKHWRNISLKLDRNGKKRAKTLRETSIRRTRSFKAHVSCTPAHTRRKNTSGQQRIKKLAVRLMEFGILNITLDQGGEVGGLALVGEVSPQAQEIQQAK